MPLPFVLPAVSRGFAELTPAACAVGAAAAHAAARSLAALLGGEVAIEARALPGATPARAPAARVTVDLPALPGQAALEVEPALVVRLVDVLAGGKGEATSATALTVVEAAALELFALCVLEGVCSVAPVEEALSPRLARGAADVASPLGVELHVRAGSIAGRARLLLPPAAVRAFRGPPALDGAAAGLRLPASLRGGTAPLAPEELDALAPGDVVVLDAPARGEHLALPGGLRAAGRLEGDGFHVEETTMAEPHAQLPVVLEVELARFEISLADLARLEPGAIVPVPIDRRGLVVLRAGERAIARGELVDVDGSVGVRVLSVEVAP